MALNPSELEARAERIGRTPLCIEWVGPRPGWLALPAAVEALAAHDVLESGDLGSDLTRRIGSVEPAPKKVLHAAGSALPELRSLSREGTYDVLAVDLSGSRINPEPHRGATACGRRSAARRQRCGASRAPQALSVPCDPDRALPASDRLREP